MFGSNWIEDYIKAGSCNIPKEKLAELASSKHHRIRIRVAENVSTPKEVLEILAKDKNPDVRLAVGTNKVTPVDIVYSLALDEDPTVRHGLAEDPNMPIGLLKILAQDENPYVGVRAQKTLLALQKHSQQQPSSLHRIIACPDHCFGTFAAAS